MTREGLLPPPIPMFIGQLGNNWVLSQWEHEIALYGAGRTFSQSPHGHVHSKIPFCLRIGPVISPSATPFKHGLCQGVTLLPAWQYISRFELMSQSSSLPHLPSQPPSETPTENLSFSSSSKTKYGI